MAIQVAERSVGRVALEAADEIAARRAARAGARGSVRAAAVVEAVPGQVVHVSGHLDVASVPDVRARLHAALDAGTGDLLAHLDEAVVADATGLGVLVGAHRRAQRVGRRLVLAGVPLTTWRLLRVTKLHRVLVLADDERAAQNRRALPSSMPRKAS